MPKSIIEDTFTTTRHMDGSNTTIRLGDRNIGLISYQGPDIQKYAVIPFVSAPSEQTAPFTADSLVEGHRALETLARRAFPSLFPSAIDRFAAARSIIGEGGRKGEVALIEDGAKVRMTLRAYEAIAEALKQAGPTALLKAAEEMSCPTHGLDSAGARQRDGDRGFVQRHNVTSAAKWLRHRADDLAN